MPGPKVLEGNARQVGRGKKAASRTSGAKKPSAAKAKGAAKTKNAAKAKGAAKAKSTGKAKGSATANGTAESVVDRLSQTKARQVFAYAEFLKGKPVNSNQELSGLTTGFDLITGDSRSAHGNRKFTKPRVIAACMVAVALLLGAGFASYATTSTTFPSYRLYTVRVGDSLSAIADRELGDPKAWRRLQELNRDRINNPTELKVGTVLRVPL